ncbi:hypothetical protein [Phycisphaera mikurensis]|uniref:Lipoprotein n=1 Tax=Phycisphaera mikurensis (strain NBRC 102666 / KCTC 22515 / FYK2301M01) TaxID=1142394 RepID=I0IBK3_PHYMF|nr:hypothetical protein [Phycisphaera mikurensis]MBB6442829.1 hypothetical protein [Phycisphaera mikurensis]BAM02641.1 hypothetical protein PSMK_04820 [Phycisphaera mikurensis NBRC 102666]
MTRAAFARCLAVPAPLLLAAAATGCAHRDAGVTPAACAASATPSACAAPAHPADPVLGTDAAAGAAISAYIDDRNRDGVYRHWDPLEGRVLEMSFESLHAGVKTMEGRQVSCADFRDQDGRLIDMDYFVDAATGVVLQGVVHKVDGVKRPYDLAAR